MSQGTMFDLRMLLLLGLFLSVSCATLAANDFEVKQIQTQIKDGRFSLDANVDLGLSATVLEALDNGVPLTFVFHTQVRRAKSWLWEDSLLDQQLHYAIRYKPLSGRYEVYRLPSTEGKEFVTRDAAIRALGEFNDIQLVTQSALEPDTGYEVQIKVFLDIEKLPLPLRPMAYLKPSWKLSSGWSKWPLTP